MASASTAAAEPSNLSAAILAEIYDTDRFGELYYGSNDPPDRNLGLAARYMVSLLRRHGIPFAFLGGWAIRLRGGRRATQDIDIAVAGYMGMDYLKAVLLQEPRLCIPQIHGATSIQVFVHTGGHWDPKSPTATVFTVSMDIIIGGNLGTPPDIPNGTEQIRPAASSTQGRQAVPVIDLFYQVSTKLSAHYTRRDESRIGGNNDYLDLDFLVRAYTEQIFQLQTYLDIEHKWTFYADFATLNDPNTTLLVSQALGLSRDTDTSQMYSVVS
ncbi:hypothetical protein GE09DRAFT_461148 [Coniochaeta sp. 2T2.1]|nr:hypothetical protein GE09DRAFT_461148 [Coniochaeta sp. 2T2.1]